MLSDVIPSLPELYAKDMRHPLKQTGESMVGPCPLCGGNDRFVFLPDKGLAFCRKCGFKGTAVQYLIDVHGYSEADAKKRAGYGRGTPVKKSSLPPSQGKAGYGAAPAPDPVNRDLWRERAKALLAQAQRDIDCPEACAFWERRCLSLETVRAVGLGWVKTDLWPYCRDWGLPESKPGQKLHIPPGALLTVGSQGLPRLMEVRCVPSVQYQGKPYTHWTIRGSEQGYCFCLGDPGQPVAVMESILDAVLLHQETRGQIAVIATLGSSKPLSQDADKLIETAPVAFAVPDDEEDEGIARRAVARWRANHATPFHIALPVGGKDLTDMHRAALTTGEALTVSEWFDECLTPLIPGQATPIPPSSDPESQEEPSSSSQEADIQSQDQDELTSDTDPWRDELREATRQPLISQPLSQRDEWHVKRLIDELIHIVPKEHAHYYYLTWFDLSWLIAVYSMRYTYRFDEDDVSAVASRIVWHTKAFSMEDKHGRTVFCGIYYKDMALMYGPVRTE